MFQYYYADSWIDRYKGIALPLCEQKNYNICSSHISSLHFLQVSSNIILKYIVRKLVVNFLYSGWTYKHGML